METDFIIVGQGICGTLLSWLLVNQGAGVVVIDEPTDQTSSKVASGLINPVTGMRVAKAWKIDELLPVALSLYRQMEQDFGISIIKQTLITDIHQSAESATIFNSRVDQYPEFLSVGPGPSEWEGYFHGEHEAGNISPSWLVDIRSMLAEWRRRLGADNSIIEAKMDWNQFKVMADGVEYMGIKANKIIFCEGAQVLNNPYFCSLPFAVNKGELLLVDIPGLPSDRIWKHKLKIAPWESALFWVGASFDWKFDTPLPTAAYRQKTEATLREILKVPFTIADHWAALRPATVQHKPFAAVHPQYPALVLFNGMGAKGCSQAPYFAQQLVQQLVYGAPGDPDAGIIPISKNSKHKK